MADLFNALMADCESRNRGWITALNFPLKCDVWLDGKLIERAVEVHRKTGRVRVHDIPAKLDKHGKRVLCRTLRGNVEVVPHG